MHMKRMLMVAALASTAALGGSMVTAQDDPASARQRNYDVGPFEEIVAVGPHHFVVTRGRDFTVRAEGPADSLEKYEVLVENGTLEIRPRTRSGREWEWEEFSVEPATYYITLPRLAAAMLAGSGDMRVDRIDGEDFSAAIAGSGELAIGAISVGEARLSVAGSGSLSASGTARNANVSIAGSGELDAPGMDSGSARINISGSGHARLTVNEDAHISIVGSGNVEIDGEARCTVSGFGSGTARCKNGVHDTAMSWGARDGPRSWRGWRGRDRN
jgi:hypothetical protein